MLNSYHGVNLPYHSNCYDSKWENDRFPILLFATVTENRKCDSEPFSHFLFCVLKIENRKNDRFPSFYLRGKIIQKFTFLIRVLTANSLSHSNHSTKGPFSYFYFACYKNLIENRKKTVFIFIILKRQNKQELSYRKQIARQLRTQYVDGTHRPKYYTVTLKSRLRFTQGYWKRYRWTDRTRLTISRVIWR